MATSNRKKDLTVSMRPLMAEDISRVSGGMMKRETGEVGGAGGVAVGGAGEQVWETWTAPFWHY